MRELLRRWREPRPHPVTGDLLPPSEYVTWQVMKVYRNWWVFFALQTLTFVWWLYPSWFPGGLAGWNYTWSDLAVVVEMMVGIAFLGQSLRDAQVLRSEMSELRSMHADLLRLVDEMHQQVTQSSD